MLFCYGAYYAGSSATGGAIVATNSLGNLKQDWGKLQESKGDAGSSSKELGDANIKDLDKLPQNKIKELGGEDYIQGAKKNSGKSKEMYILSLKMEDHLNGLTQYQEVDLLK